MAEFKLKQTAEEVQMAVDNGLSFGEFPTGGDTLIIPMYSDEELNAKIESGEITLVAEVFAKVSDAIPTMSDLSNGAVFSSTDMHAVFPAEEFVDHGGVIAGMDATMWIVSESMVGVDLGDGSMFPESGIYLFLEFLETGASLTIPGYTGFPVTKKIEQKYLPGAVILYEDAEMYLCSDSTLNERITQAQLKEMISRGSQIYIRVPVGDFAPIGFNHDEIFSLVFINTVDGLSVAFTAEYVPE